MWKEFTVLNNTMTPNALTEIKCLHLAQLNGNVFCFATEASKKQKQPNTAVDSEMKITPSTGCTSLDSLRKKLNARIQSMKGKVWRGMG